MKRVAEPAVAKTERIDLASLLNSSSFASTLHGTCTPSGISAAVRPAGCVAATGSNRVAGWPSFEALESALSSIFVFESAEVRPKIQKNSAHPTCTATTTTTTSNSSTTTTTTTSHHVIHRSHVDQRRAVVRLKLGAADQVPEAHHRACASFPDSRLGAAPPPRVFAHWQLRHAHQTHQHMPHHRSSSVRTAVVSHIETPSHEPANQRETPHTLHVPLRHPPTQGKRVSSSASSTA